MKTNKPKLFTPNIPKKIKNLSWAESKARFPLMKPYGDADKDGLKNYRDCKPFDWKKKGEDHEMTEDDYGFKMVYKKGGKKAPTAEELIAELE